MRIRCVPDIGLSEPKDPKFRNPTSAMIAVPTHLGKNGHPYTIFGDADWASAQLSYFRARINAGEKPTPAGPIIAADPRGHASARKVEDRTVFVSRKSLAWTIATRGFRDVTSLLRPSTGIWWNWAMAID